MDIKLYKSKRVDDSEFNGGYEDCTAEIVSGVFNNLFPDVMPNELSSGITRYRKAFVHTVGETSGEAYLGIHDRSTGGDYFRLHAAATTGQTQGALLAVSTPKWYGTGKLVSAAPSGSTQITVLFDEALPDLANNDKGLLVEGNTEELHTVSSFTATGACALITLAQQTSHSFSTSARFCHLLPLGAIYPSWSDWNESSSSGSYDENNHPPVVYTYGTIEDTWTLTFSDATHFTCSGTSTGSIGSGTTGSNFSPQNPAGGTYFTIYSSGWGGTWANGDTITFKTHPSSKPAWIKEVVPSGCSSTPNNEVPLVVFYA